MSNHESQNIKMPVIFVGHGSPMNAIEKNEFSIKWNNIGSQLPVPELILCISAHWETDGTHVTAMKDPRTIHDFYGFPEDLYKINYPAPGSPERAEETKKIITETEVVLDNQWGLDHGCWSVLYHMYPQANIPVVQLSLDRTKPPEYHYNLAKQLAALRDKKVLIIGSGNMVHNLRMIDWNDKVFDWALEFDNKLAGLITNCEHAPLINYSFLGAAAKLSIPTNEHYLPLLYILALQEDKEHVQFFNEQITLGSISMRGVIIGG